MTKNHRGSANPWLAKSKQDLETGQLLLKEGGYPDTICYFAHQAVEKALKGFLIQGGVRPDKIHNLIKLASEAEKISPGLKNLREEVAALNDYYIPAKYPVDVPVEYSKADASSALKMAEDILNFIQNKV